MIIKSIQTRYSLSGNFEIEIKVTGSRSELWVYDRNGNILMSFQSWERAIEVARAIIELATKLKIKDRKV